MMSDSHTAPHGGPFRSKWPVKHRREGFATKTAVMASSCSAREIESPVIQRASATFFLPPQVLNTSVHPVSINVKHV